MDQTASKNTDYGSHCKVLWPQTRSGSEDHQTQWDGWPIRHIPLRCMRQRRKTQNTSELKKRTIDMVNFEFTHAYHVLGEISIALWQTPFNEQWALLEWIWINRVNGTQMISHAVHFFYELYKHCIIIEALFSERLKLLKLLVASSTLAESSSFVSRCLWWMRAEQ